MDSKGQPFKIPTIGRIVNFHVEDENGEKDVRPAIVVRVTGDTINVQVLVDNTNDRDLKMFAMHELNSGIAWRQSLQHGVEKGMWSWPVIEARVDQKTATEAFNDALDKISETNKKLDIIKRKMDANETVLKEDVEGFSVAIIAEMMGLYHYAMDADGSFYPVNKKADSDLAETSSAAQVNPAEQSSSAAPDQNEGGD